MYDDDFFMLCTPDGYRNFKEALQDLYINKLMSLESIGHYIGVSNMVIRKKLEEFSIPIRPRGTNQNTIKQLKAERQ